MIILAFLTVRPSELFYKFVKQLKNDQYDVYIFIDDNNYDIPNYDNEINIIKIDNTNCEEDGFKNTVAYCKNKACSRDKALYYFCKNDIEYEYIWFIEEDVFIPDLNTISNIDNKYKNADLLSRCNNIWYNKQDSNNWYWWQKCITECKFEIPFCFSLISAIRVSKQLLICINNCAKAYNTLFMDEILFNTLAYQNNLTVINPIELSTIYSIEWEWENIDKKNLYHAVKSVEKQYNYRKNIV